MPEKTKLFSLKKTNLAKDKIIDGNVMTGITLWNVLLRLISSSNSKFFNRAFHQPVCCIIVS